MFRKFSEDRNSILGYAGIFFTYIAIFVFVIVIHSNLVAKAELEMKFNSEKSFNSVYLAITENPENALEVMKREKVDAVGIYSSNGQRNLWLGDAPEFLPFDNLVKSKKGGIDSTLGVYAEDRETKRIEYLRLSKLNVAFETGTLQFFQYTSENSNVVDIPEIVYVKFDGTSYFAELNRIQGLLVFLIAFVTFILILVLRTYYNNLKFREELSKHQNLVNLGSAARTLTHEIKNPLAALTIQSALLKKTLPEEYEPDLDVINHEIQRLSDLTNRVSDFLRNPEGVPEEIEMISFLEDIIRIFPERIGLNAKDLDHVYVSFDKDRARSVFENLIKNAVESCNDRDPQVEIEVYRSKRRRLNILIMDRGDGLPKKTDKIFDPFYTTKLHGSGIGLSISKQFIAARGGILKLYGRNGGGTVAEVVLSCYMESAL